MPEISFFFGIRITMNSKDHNKPHFHASYGEYKANFDFDGEITKGKFPPKQAKIVAAWAVIHKDELLKNWELAKEGEHTFDISPLK
ncbi:MAG: DUF4160 domain-containing protein [Chitinivibrionia bacterium]|nr:DUF4160 domain-containing protein [Chitinivibrionia bacterium]